MGATRERAIELFYQGYNCSQAVFGAYAERYGIEKDIAMRLAASFGGGMGRMREVCGALSGALIVVGMETGATEGRDAAGKKANYDMVQKVAGIYKEKNGSIYCKELLGLVPMPNGEKRPTAVTQDTQKKLTAAEYATSHMTTFTETTPEARTKEYYKKRPCPELIGQVCDILDEVLYSQSIQKEENRLWKQ